MNQRPYLAILASLFLALPALAEDTSQFSDEVLHREQARLLSHRWSNDPGKGYDGRITSSDHEVEFQMQQMDKAREREHHARYNMIEDELRLRAQARAKAAQEREAEERQANADASHNDAVVLEERPVPVIEHARTVLPDGVVQLNGRPFLSLLPESKQSHESSTPLKLNGHETAWRSIRMNATLELKTILELNFVRETGRCRPGTWGRWSRGQGCLHPPVTS